MASPMVSNSWVGLHFFCTLLSGRRIRILLQITRMVILIGIMAFQGATLSMLCYVFPFWSFVYEPVLFVNFVAFLRQYLITLNFV